MKDTEDHFDMIGEELLDKRTITGGEITYRILSKNVREYHFVVPFDEKAEVGEIFSVKDGDLTFLARVLDIRHDSNYEGKWDTTLKGTLFYDKDQIFNRVIAEPLGTIEGGRFRKARTIPAKFSPVERADESQFSFLGSVMGEIEVGVLRNGSQEVPDIPVRLHSHAMDHHMGVFATTGMGKSNFMKVFAASCMKLAALEKSHFGLLIVDPHGEYLMGKGIEKGLLNLKNYSDGLVSYSTDREKAIISDVEELKIGMNEIEPLDVSVLYDWSPAQMDALEAIPRFFEESWLSDIQTEEGMARMAADYREGTIGVIARRIRTVLERNRYIDSRRSSVPGMIANLMKGKVVLVDIPRMSDRSELFLLSILSRRILDEYKREDAKLEDRKSCLITIEEAQRVLGGSEGSLVTFETIAREGRKFGVGLCAITQQPKLVDKQLLSQFNTLVILGLADRNDRMRLEESAKQDLTSLDVEIQTLEKGEAIISTLNVPFPIPAKIHRYEDYLNQLKKEKLGGGEMGDVRRGGFRPTLD